MKVYLALPTYDGKSQCDSMWTVLNAPAGKHPSGTFVKPVSRQSSLLGKGFCLLWAEAVQLGFDVFAMLHADIAVANKHWLMRLIEIMRTSEAGVLSAVVRLKDDSGETSTAYELPTVKTLHIAEIARLPEVFGRAEVSDMIGQDCGRLLVNTGCFVADIRQPWARQVDFAVETSIDWKQSPPYVNINPEDWRFSRMVADAGGVVKATKALKTEHCGVRWYCSDGRDSDKSSYHHA